MTKMQKNDDAKMTTVENAVRHSPILEDVPERDIPFERFLREGGPQFREKLIRSESKNTLEYKNQGLVVNQP